MTALSERKSILLLMSPATYRAGAFLAAAQKLDLAVVVGVDLPELLGEYWHVPLSLDLADVDHALAQILVYARKHPVCALLSVDDSATELATRASNALGLSHNEPYAAEAARDKYIMRSRMSSAGMPCPVFRLFRLDEDAASVATQVSYPCVLKPRKLSGSRGVIRADTPEEFRRAQRRLRDILLHEGSDLNEATYLVEDFIPGMEIALEGLMTHDTLHVLALFDKPDPLDGPFFEETLYVTPSRLPDTVQQDIAYCIEQAAHAVGLHEGPIHAESRINANGVWMLELAGRSIGGLCSTILEFGTGMTLEEIILRHAIGENIPSLERAGTAVGVMMIPIPASGLLKRVDGVEDARSVSGVTGVEITARLNQPLLGLPEGASYLGFIFARGDTPAAVEYALRDAHSRLHCDIRVLLPVL